MKIRKAKKTAIKEVKVKKTDTRLELAKLDIEKEKVKRSRVIWAAIITNIYPIMTFIQNNWDSFIHRLERLLGLF